MEIQQASIVLGPATIADIGRAVGTLMPWLSRSRAKMLPDGNIEFADPEPAEAVRLLRGAVERFLPEDVRADLGARSGLGWKLFFGHVVTWWLPQRGRLGFLRALVDRAALHRVRLDLHWNEGSEVPVVRQELGNNVLWWGGLAGVVGGFAVREFFPRDSVLALLAAASGIVAARIAQRIIRRRSCGDPLCRAPLGRAKFCPSCGGQIAN